MLKVSLFHFSSFKLFLELEPQLRDIIHQFYESKYASCLKLLDDIKVNIQFQFIDGFVNKELYDQYNKVRLYCG